MFNQSAVAPEARTTLPQRSVSLLMKRANSSGVLVHRSKAWMRMRWRMSGERSASISFAFSFATMGLGIPAGPTMPSLRRCGSVVTQLDRWEATGRGGHWEEPLRDTPRRHERVRTHDRGEECGSAGGVRKLRVTPAVRDLDDADERHRWPGRHGVDR